MELCQSTHPKHSFEVEPAGRARVLQLEPLVHGKLWGDQQAVQRDGQTAQGQGPVVVLHLWEKGTQRQRGSGGVRELQKCGDTWANTNGRRIGLVYTSGLLGDLFWPGDLTHRLSFHCVRGVVTLRVEGRLAEHMCRPECPSPVWEGPGWRRWRHPPI